MYRRICIFALAISVAANVCHARTLLSEPYPRENARTDTLETVVSERNRKLYDSIEQKTKRRAVPRMLYRLLFVKPVLDTTANGQILDESRRYARYAGKTIGSISIERAEPFNTAGHLWVQRAGNTVHVLTRERVIRRDLLFKTGDSLAPQLIVRNQQLLRSRDYISDADILAQTDSLDTTRVNLIVRTRDRFTIGGNLSFDTRDRMGVGLYESDLFGSGNTLRVTTNLNWRNFSYGGNIVEYAIPNVLGTFFTADFSAGHNFFESQLTARADKDFINPTDYGVGVAYNNLKFRRYMIDRDTSIVIRERSIDAWSGYSHLFPSLDASFYFTGRYSHVQFSHLSEISPVTRTNNPALRDYDAMLVGVGFYREKFYTSSMVYGFGRREDIPTGFKAELVGGYSWNRFANEMYLGANWHKGSFGRLGYITGGVSFGSYIDLANGHWSRSAVDVDLKWFSQLFLVRRSRIRQFLAFSYTQGWNRGTGSDEMLRFTDTNGLEALKQYVTGTNRAILNTETVLFTPWQPLNFRIAFFGFADFGLIGYSPNTFKNSFYTSFGFGVRIRNEHLIFNTLQIRLGIAFGKNGLVNSQYFHVGDQTRIQQFVEAGCSVGRKFTGFFVIDIQTLNQPGEKFRSLAVILF